jgi:nucleoid-associated protein YgaU
MERKTMIIITLVVTLVLLGIIAAAESFFDNPDYKKAKELNKAAEKAFQEGEYDKAYELAEEARKFADKADAYAAMLVQRNKANTLMYRASKRIEFVKEQGADKTYPKEYGRAVSDYQDAKKSFESDQYDRSIEYANKVIAELEGIVPKTPLPKYYRVRLIPRRRDCFWRIAGYEFIYNNPWKWTVIYQANRQKLRNSNDPDLIYPGQTFLIPSINGEYREGTYDPNKQYF